MQRTAAIVLAGGSGTRLGISGGKQLTALAGFPVMSWALMSLDEVEGVEHIVVVCPADRLAEYKAVAVDPLDLRTPVSFAPSGVTRQMSAANGLASLPSGFDIVAIHDGARPLVGADTIAGALAMLESNPDMDGVVVGHPSVDTLKIVEDGRIMATPERSRYWIAQTPQIFRLEVFTAALSAAEESGFAGTDDSALVEHAGGRVMMFEGPRDNMKVTFNEDLAVAEAMLHQRSGDM